VPESRNEYAYQLTFGLEDNSTKKIVDGKWGRGTVGFWACSPNFGNNWEIWGRSTSENETLRVFPARQIPEGFAL